MISSNIFKGKKVRLTAVTKEDLPAITSWYEDAGFARLFDAIPAQPKSLDQWSKWLEDQQKVKDNYLFAIRPLDGEGIIGYVQLEGILWNHQNGWIGIGLGDRQNWGKGYGLEAMQIILKFAFHELNLHRVQLNVFSYNNRAIALYDKMGFVREGIIREYLQRDGNRHDLINFGLLRHEWEGDIKEGE